MQAGKLRFQQFVILEFVAVLAVSIANAGGPEASGDFAAQRKCLVETLDRGLVGIPKSRSEVFLSWRMLGLDPESIQFNVYRKVADGEELKLNSQPLQNTWLIDDSWDSSRETSWRVEAIADGLGQDLGGTFSLPARPPQLSCLTVPLQRPPAGQSADGKTFEYTANDATVADLDGDGDYEVILRWEPTNTWGGGHGRHTGPVLIDAYTLEGQHLWRIDLGININASAHITQMTAFDLDSDGRAEIALLTADGTVDGQGHVIGDPHADHRRPDGVVLSGPEYLTIFDGLTGRELQTVLFIPQRHPETDSPTADQIWDIWGDNYGNRMNRFGACVAYLDGRHPHLVTTRGYYGGRGGRGGRTCLAAWRWRDGNLDHVWTFDTLGHPELQGYIGQGNHQVSVADLDNDGRDEIVYGACAIDDDGSGLYTTRLGHGDALHVTDMDPSRPGLEVFTIHEGTGHDAGVEFRAADGSAIWKKHPHRDVGRGVAFDIDPTSPGFEFWSSGGDGIFNVQGEKICDRRPRWTNMGIWWDGDLLRELLDGQIIDKWDFKKSKESRQLTAYSKPYFAAKNNGTKSNPCLVADVLGDWREELILRSEDNSRLMIFVSTIPTEYRLRTLMHDPQYRVAVDWQNVGYNQPPHPGFYLGDGMSLPQRPFAVQYTPLNP